MNLPRQQIPPRQVTFANKTTGTVSEAVILTLQVGKYRLSIPFVVADIGEEVILGLPWVRSVEFHRLSWANGILEFNELNSRRRYSWKASWLKGDRAAAAAQIRVMDFTRFHGQMHDQDRVFKIRVKDTTQLRLIDAEISNRLVHEVRPRLSSLG